MRVSRLIGRVSGSEVSGPTLLCLGGIHGNEPSGVLALKRVLATLEQDSTGLVGQLICFSGNRSALAGNVRHHRLDMNRVWRSEILDRVREMEVADLRDEEIELRELDAALADVLGEADGLLDLHSTSGPGEPFVTMDDTLQNRSFASALPVPRVLGLQEAVEGTLTSFIIANAPIPAIGFESGPHAEESTVDHAAAAVWIALETLGALAKGRRTEPAEARALLTQRSGGLSAVVEVRYRHAVQPDSEFKMEPGFHSFQRVARGQVLALERTGPVKSPVDGLMLMPRYQPIGSDGFFLVREVHPVWLGLSASLRRLRAERWVHLLPGVRRHPERSGSFLTSGKQARGFVQQVFQLLGFCREPTTGHETIMTPRNKPHRPNSS